MTTYGARWIFPADGPPIANGTIAIEGDRIISVGARSASKESSNILASAAGSETIDLGHVAILPGFVNAHTHLDLSDAAGLYSPTPDYLAWLKQVIAHRRQQTPESLKLGVAEGIRQLIRSGTTLVGDIATQDASWDALRGAPMNSVSFFEVVGMSPARAQQFFEQARSKPAISPHAPYSVRASLLEQLAPLPWVRWAMHLGEFREEADLLERRTGPFVAFLDELGIWNREAPAASWRDIVNLPWSTPPLWIHGNYLAPTDVTQGTIVYCPRTHAAFGHPPHPFRDFPGVCLGTDSLASNPDLDILAEARWLASHHPDIPGEMLLRMITLHGAEAMGYGMYHGSLKPGKSANLVVLPLPDRDETDPYRLVFASDIPVSRSMFQGEWIVLEDR